MSLYAILDVGRGADSSELRRAYRTRALAAHPDKGGDTEVFKRIQFAYNTLSDPKKREIYDKYGEQGLQLNERFPLLDARFFLAIKRSIAFLALFVLLIVATCVLLCMRVDHLISISYMLVFTPLLSGLVLAALLTFSMRDLRNEDNNHEDERDRQNPRRMSILEVLIVMIPVILLCTFIVILALAANGTLSPAYIAIPWSLIELPALVANFIQFHATRSRSPTTPLLITALDVFSTQILRITQGVLLLCKVSGSIDASYRTIFIPMYLHPLVFLIGLIFTISRIRTTPNDLSSSPTPSPWGPVIVSFVVHVFMYALFYTTLGLIIARLSSTTESPSLTLCLVPLWIVLSILFCCFGCCLPCMLFGLESGLADDGDMEALRRYADVISYKKRIAMPVSPQETVPLPMMPTSIQQQTNMNPLQRRHSLRVSESTMVATVEPITVLDKE